VPDAVVRQADAALARRVACDHVDSPRGRATTWIPHAVEAVSTARRAGWLTRELGPSAVAGEVVRVLFVREVSERASAQGPLS